MSKSTIWLLCLVLTPISGAVMYYAWRSKNLAAANYANRVSWVSWLLWLGVGFGLRGLVHA